MNKEDKLAAMKRKEYTWSPALKEFYEPKDVLRYFKEVYKIIPSSEVIVIPPERFFTVGVIAAGLVLKKEDDLKNLNNELAYLQDCKIPELILEIEKLEKS